MHEFNELEYYGVRVSTALTACTCAGFSASAACRHCTIYDQMATRAWAQLVGLYTAFMGRSFDRPDK